MHQKEVYFIPYSISYLETLNRAKEIEAVRNNMAILKETQDILSSQIQKTFNFINWTCAETDTNRLLLTSLQKDTLQINSHIHCLSKELTTLFHVRNFFVIIFQLRSCLATLCNGINSVKIDILSILDQVSVISSQKLKLVLLNPFDLKSLLTKLETQLVLYPWLALLQWNSENIWYMYKFMKLWFSMMSDTLYVIVHIPLVDKPLQFNLYRICNIPLVNLILKRSFRYSIQEEYLAIRSATQYILFPPSTDIMACQVSNSQFCNINSPLYTTDTLSSCSYVLLLQNKDKINFEYDH